MIEDVDIIDDTDSEILNEVIIGEGTTADNPGIPIGCNSFFKYLGSSSLYLSSDIGRSGTITSLGWYDESGASDSRPIIIYLKETSDTTVSSTFWSTQISGATEVYNGSITTVAGWNDFTLTTPFAYNGTSNLLVLVEVDSLYCTSSYYRYTVTEGMFRQWKEDSTIDDRNPSSSDTSSRPNIKITF